jgi:hypothetical protein
MDASGTRIDHDARAEGAAGPRIPSPPAAAVGYAAV